MKLIPFAEQNTVIAENQKEYAPMPCNIDRSSPYHITTMCWELTPEEIAEVQRTGKIWHQVYTFGQPMQPQLLRTDKPEMVNPGLRS